MSSHENEKKIRAKRYQIEKKLGFGNYGTAFLVTDLKTDELKVLKEVPIGDMQPDESVESVQEANLLSKLDNPYILRYHDSFLDGEYFCIVTEYCEGGDLDVRFKELKKQNKCLSEEQILDWTVQLLSAVNFLHSRRVLHRDLKARNVFLKNETVKLGDFGISKILNSTVDLAQTFTGTPYYMSPEVLKHEGYNSKSDVWSIGCLLYEMCTFKHAFEGQGLMGVMYKIIECDVPELPNYYSSELNNLLKKIFIKDPDLRPSSSELLREPLIGNHIKKMIHKLEIARTQDLDSTVAIKKDRNEIVKALNEKITLHDLKMQQNRKESEDYSSKTSRRNDSDNDSQDKDTLTPKQRLLQKKIQKADQEAAIVGKMAKENLMERMMRDTYRREHTIFNSSLSTNFTSLARYEAKPHMNSLNDDSLTHNHLSKTVDFSSRSVKTAYHRNHLNDSDDDNDVNYANKNMSKTLQGVRSSSLHNQFPSGDDDDEDEGTLLKTVQYSDQYRSKQSQTLRTSHSAKTLRNTSYDARPIVPLKKQIEKAFDEDGIPVDPQLTNEYYENFDDFEKDDDENNKGDDDDDDVETYEIKQIAKKHMRRNNRNKMNTLKPDKKEHQNKSSLSKTLNAKSHSEYEHLVNIKNSVLENPAKEEKTITDGSSGAFGPHTRAIKIKNLRAQAIKELGEQVFEDCYKYLKDKRRSRTDEAKIFDGLKKLTSKSNGCFLVEQLLFLEESA